MNISITSTRGLVKSINEDVVKHSKDTFSICDGHWGNQAAKLACKTTLEKFPNSRTEAINLLKTIQKRLFDLQTSKQPPEASVLAVKLNNNIVTILSYGDCRMLIVRNNKIFFSLRTKSTWLGALSHQQIRGRLSIQQGLIFKKLQLKAGDKIYMFTDGVDECIYERPTIPHHWIATHNAQEIFTEIKKNGAEDNASLVILEC